MKKSTNHLGFRNGFEIFISSSGLQIMKAKQDQPIDDDGFRVGAFIVCNGVKQVADECKRMTGRYPSDLGITAHTDAARRVTYAVHKMTGYHIYPELVDTDAAGIDGRRRAGGIQVFGRYQITKLIRTLAFRGYSRDDIVTVLESAGVSPNMNTVKTQYHKGSFAKREDQDPKHIGGLYDLPRKIVVEVNRAIRAAA